MNANRVDPVVHSHISKSLPSGHRLAHQNVICAKCHKAVHSSQNECVSTWVETGRGDYCLWCFVMHLTDLNVIDHTWGLRVPDADMRRFLTSCL